MSIVNGTELCALTSKKKKQIENAEFLRQKISNSISGNINFKMRGNLTFEQQTTLKELSQSTENTVYSSFDKGIDFVILKPKIEEQIGKSIVSNNNPTSTLTNKIKNHLATLRKQQKFETRTCF